MKPDAFLYLMSSLIQVFGTLVAADTVFLVVLHDSLSKRLSQLTLKLGLLIELVERGSYWTYFPPITSRNLHIAEYSDRAQVFLTQSDSEQEQRLNDAEGLMKRQLETQSTSPSERAKVENGVQYFTAHRRQHEDIRHRLQQFSRLVVMTMIGPAVLSLLFAVLLWAGSETEWYRATAGFSLVLACAGFAWIIFWAVRAWPKQEEASRKE